MPPRVFEVYWSGACVQTEYTSDAGELVTMLNSTRLERTARRCDVSAVTWNRCSPHPELVRPNTLPPLKSW